MIFQFDREPQYLIDNRLVCRPEPKICHRKLLPRHIYGEHGGGEGMGEG